MLPESFAAPVVLLLMFPLLLHRDGTGSLKMAAVATLEQVQSALLAGSRSVMLNSPSELHSTVSKLTSYRSEWCSVNRRCAELSVTHI